MQGGLPDVGSVIRAFGYPRTSSELGDHHLAFTTDPTTSSGVVTAVYPKGRDRVMLPFPCYEVNARFDAGKLAGLICSSIPPGLDDTSATHTSYVACLWPMLAMEVDYIRPNRPYDLSQPAQRYLAYELFVDGYLRFTDFERFAKTEHGIVFRWLVGGW